MENENKNGVAQSQTGAAAGVVKTEEKVTKPAPKKNGKGKKAKAPKVTLASKIDEAISHGGRWENLIEKANKASKEMKSTLHYTKGTLMAHINYRLSKDKGYLKGKKITKDGILYPKAKAEAEKVAAEATA